MTRYFKITCLEEAYKRVKSNNGSPGIDKQTFSDVERYGIGRNS